MSKEVVYTDSKPEIWKAYKEVVSKLDEVKPVTSTTESASIETVKKAVSVSNLFDEKSITACIDSLQFMRTNYNSLAIAINEKTKVLQDVYDVEVSANSLAALAKVKEDLIADSQLKADEIIERAKATSESLTNSASVIANNVRAEIKAERETEKLNREREKDIYEYDFSRMRTKRMNELKDEIEEQNRLMYAREAELNIREATLAEKDQVIKDLTGKIEYLKQISKAEVAVAVEDAVAKAKKSADISKGFSDREHQSDIRIKDAKIESLEDKIKDMSEQLKSANDRIAESTASISGLAQSALNAQANAKTITEVAKMTQSKNA